MRQTTGGHERRAECMITVSFEQHTGSSERAWTAYSSSSEVDVANDDGSSLRTRGRDIRSVNVGSGTGGLCFRAMTFGTEVGLTSMALPTRSHLDPG